MRTVYPPPPPRAPAGSAASTPASRCAPSRTIARTRAGSVRLILSYSAVSDTGRVAPAALTAAWIDGRNPNVTEASKSTTASHPIRHLPTPRQRYLAGGHLERGGCKAPVEGLGHCARWFSPERPES